MSTASSTDPKNDATLVRLGPVVRRVLRLFPIETLLAEVLRRVPPKVRAFYSLVMFNFLNLFRPAVTVEVFVFRDTAEGTQVLFRERAATDVGYPDTVHAPGSYLLMKESVTQAIDRIVAREIGSQAEVAGFYPAGVLEDRHEERGHHIHLVFLVRVGGVDETDKLHWYPVNNLPTNTVDHHRGMMLMAYDVHSKTTPPSVLNDYTP